MQRFLAPWVLLAVWTSLATGASAPAPAPAAAPPASALVDEFATFGLSLEPPAGWERLWEGRTTMIARWSDSKPGTGATAMITLELTPTRGQTLDQHEDALRAQFRDAKLVSDPLPIGGGPAVRVTGQAPGGEVDIEALATLHGQYFYLITAWAAGPETMPRAAMEKLARSLKFREIADPSACVALRAPQKLHERFTLSPLVTMRPDAEPRPPGNFALVVNNYRTNRAGMLMEVQVLPNPAKLPLEKLGQSLTDQMTRRQPVPWGVMRSTPPRAISKPFTFALPDGRKIHSRVALIQLSDTEVIFLNFGMDSGGAEAATTAYETACEEIAKSVQPVQK